MPTQHPWKRRLLIIELGSLAVLVLSLVVLGRSGEEGGPVSRAWLLLPLGASLATFLSFLGLMYLRWQASSEPGTRQRIQLLLFWVMVVTLLGTWAFAAVETWRGLEQQGSDHRAGDNPIQLESERTEGAQAP